MIEAGDIHLADVNQEQRLRMLVVLSGKFSRLSGRARVSPSVAASVQRVTRHIL